MNREQKQAVVEELKGILTSSRAMVLVSMTRLNMETTTGLRATLRKEGGRFQVIKNTLFGRAVEGTPLAFLGEKLAGPLAVAYTDGDPVGLAKALVGILKSVQGLQFVVGVLGTRSMNEAQLKALATLPSAEVLRAMLLGTFGGVPRKFLGLLQAPARDFLGVLKARERQLTEQAA
ncbi:MAG TPA: 50S ribosomal protein L10 [Myxococcota bacterium]|nr:50S ribosomal protein L10 [Myxococcota bacterium]HQK49853.1 50S ribosomal protein L10 [Myxococcota bacterium]